MKFNWFFDKSGWRGGRPAFNFGEQLITHMSVTKVFHGNYARMSTGRVTKMAIQKIQIYLAGDDDQVLMRFILLIDYIEAVRTETH